MKGIFIILLVFAVLATLKENGMLGSPAALQNTPMPTVQGINGREQPSVVMYATKSCGYCRRARVWMTENDIVWDERDVEASSSANREMRALGGRGVPTFLIGGSDVIKGYNVATLREKLL